MAKTGIHIKRANIGSVEAHNLRTKEYIAGLEKAGRSIYFFPELTHLNESWVNPEYKGKSCEQIQDELVELYRQKVGQKPQLKDRTRVNKKTGKEYTVAGWSPIREGVVPIMENTTLNDFQLVKEWAAKKGLAIIRIDLHQDEGYRNEATGDTKYNRHAHILFDWVNHATGKTLKLNEKDMSEFQDIVAESLQMERGTRKADTGLEHVPHIEYREQKAKKELSMTEEERKKSEIKKKENEFIAEREKEWMEEELKELQEEIELKREEKERVEKRLDFDVKKVKELEGEIGTLEEKERKLKQNISELKEVKREGEEELKELQEEIEQKREEKGGVEKRLDFDVKKVKELDGVVGTLEEKERKLKQNISELKEEEREKRDTIDLLDDQIRIKDEFLATRDEEIEKRGEEMLPIEKFREIDDLSADSYDIACQAYQYGISMDATKKLIEGEEVEIGSIKGEPFPYGPIKVKVQRIIEIPTIVGYFQNQWQTLKSIYHKVKEMVTNFINYRISDTQKKTINLQERGKGRGRSI